MSLLTLDKIEQLQIQLDRCTNLQTASTFRIAISRLESQLHSSKPEHPGSFTEEVLLQPLISTSKAKIYHPTPADNYSVSIQANLSDYPPSMEVELKEKPRNSDHLSSELMILDQGKEAILQLLVDQGKVKVYHPIQFNR